jgi:Rieske Fe-S protein
MDTRRRTLLAAGAAGAAALVSGCGNSDEEGGSASEQPASAAPGTTSEPPGSAPAGDELAKISDIPAGGGKIFDSEKAVVTQPEAGEFKAFSAVCPHQGCLVKTVADGTIDCLCHGSKFRITDGSVAAGPATGPLPEKEITVSGDAIRLV